MSESVPMIERVLQNPGQFPPDCLARHKALAGTLFALGHPPFVLNDNEDLVSAPVTNPLTTELGAQMTCDTCPAKQECDPAVAVLQDDRILVQGWYVGAPECEIAHPMPHAQTQSSSLQVDTFKVIKL